MRGHPLLLPSDFSSKTKLVKSRATTKDNAHQNSYHLNISNNMLADGETVDKVEIVKKAKIMAAKRTPGAS